MVSIQKVLVTKEKYRYFTGIGSIGTSLSVTITTEYYYNK